MGDIDEDIENYIDIPVDDVKLVEAVEKYPALYNIKLAEYHTTGVKERCWEIISRDLGHSVGKCMERWVRLKDNYRREKNKRESESRSGQGLSCRKGFALYASMDFLRPHLMKRKSFTNVKSAKRNAATAKRMPGHSVSQFTTNATWGTQYHSALPLNPSMSCTMTSECQDQLFTLPQSVLNSPLLTSWDSVLPATTLNSPTSIVSTQCTQTSETSTPVWLQSTAVPTPSSTISQSLATNGMSQARTSPSANVTQPVTFITPTTSTDPTIGSTPAAECIDTLTSTTSTELSVTYTPPVTPSPPIRTLTPLQRIPTPSIRVPQSSPNYTYVVSPSATSSCSLAPRSPADPAYSAMYSDLSCDFNPNDADTIPTKNRHVTSRQNLSVMKSASASLSSPPGKLLSQTYSPATPKNCYNKDARQKKLDPLEACMISLSNSIKGKLEAEPVPKQAVRTSDEVFGDMVASELSRMSEGNKAVTKGLIVDILFAKIQ